MEFLTRVFFFSKFMKQENWLGGGMVPESGRVSELSRRSGDISDPPLSFRSVLLFPAAMLLDWEVSVHPHSEECCVPI